MRNPRKTTRSKFLSCFEVFLLISFLISGDHQVVIFFRDAIKQVLLIALNNALKHSSGDINITAQQNGTQLEIRVQDFGEGISPEKLEHVFDRFYRGEDTSTIPGFGLGLSIAKTLIDGMGGEIVMESELGKGSTVIMHFRYYDG